MQLESHVDTACQDVCFLDGNDIGSGTYNLYLYTSDVPETVKRLVALEQSRQIPTELRVAVAKYKDGNHTDWTYEPVYPPTLKHFELFNRPPGGKPKPTP